MAGVSMQRCVVLWDVCRNLNLLMHGVGKAECCVVSGVECGNNSCCSGTVPDYRLRGC